jgi:hypothetical protein
MVRAAQEGGAVMKRAGRKLVFPETWLIDSLRDLPWYEQRWIQRLVLALVQAPAGVSATCRRQDAELMGHRGAPLPAPTPDPDAISPSSCCGKESYPWRHVADTLFLRCTACRQICGERPGDQRPTLRMIDGGQAVRS